MNIQLSDHFTYGKLIKFTISSIAMMIFNSIYGVVDGFFVSNYAGKIPFAAVNLIYAFFNDCCYCWFYVWNRWKCLGC